MDWIESWFGISPDGGDGSVEWLFVLAGVALVVAAVPPLRRRALALLQRVAALLPAVWPKTRL